MTDPRTVIACALTRPDHTDPSPMTLALADAILTALDEAGWQIWRKLNLPPPNTTIYCDPWGFGASAP